MAAEASTQTPTTQQFDLTMDDDAHDVQDGLSTVLGEQERRPGVDDRFGV